MNWQLNRIQYPVHNLGPGVRIGIWVQGCGLACPGCLNPSLWNRDGGKAIPVESVLERLLSLADGYDGITITGGEPFDQYEPLIAFCSFIKRKTNLNIWVYSGYTLEELERRHKDRLFTGCLDFLMDGRYVHALNNTKPLRGSGNQRLYQFIQGEPRENHSMSENPNWSVHVSDDHKLFLTGIPRKGELDSIQNELSHAGIKVRFV